MARWRRRYVWPIQAPLAVLGGRAVLGRVGEIGGGYGPPAFTPSPTAGARGNHGPIVGAKAAPHIAIPVAAQIAVRIAIVRLQDDWRRSIPVCCMSPDVRPVRNCVGKPAGAGKRERRGQCHCRKFHCCLLCFLDKRQLHHHQ
jgi:hypothetical protein